MLTQHLLKLWVPQTQTKLWVPQTQTIIWCIFQAKYEKVE